MPLGSRVFAEFTQRPDCKRFVVSKNKVEQLKHGTPIIKVGVATASFSSRTRIILNALHPGGSAKIPVIPTKMLNGSDDGRTLSGRMVDIDGWADFEDKVPECPVISK